MNKIDNEPFNPNWASPPGDTIIDTIECLKIDFNYFCQRMMMTQADMHRLLRGEIEINDDLAYRLEIVLGINRQFWINREKHYRDKLKELNG